MNILKFEKKNFITTVKSKKLKNSSVNIKKIEKKFVFFSKKELSLILNLYSKQVSKGFWKDYALDNQTEYAIFSVYKHSHDKPLYRIIKNSHKGFINKPNFYIKKDEKIISKSSDLYIILLMLEKKLSIKKLKNN
tara:strand:+ start:183 stop:587 length:405 start_codon:yes stop_codon:yes gene_type:complete